jgi:hypothetical protein
LLVACQKGHVDVAKLLLCEGGASVDLQNNDGVSPLWIACDQGHVKIVELLLTEGKANVHLCDNQDEAPIDCTDSVSIQVLLLIHGASSTGVSASTVESSVRVVSWLEAWKEEVGVLERNRYLIRDVANIVISYCRPSMCEVMEVLGIN